MPSRAWYRACARWAVCRCASPCRANGAVGASAPAAAAFFKRKVSQQQLLQFTRELGTLLTAGLPLDRSLSILGGLFEGGEFSKVMRSLVEAVRAGKSLAVSMGEHPDVFPKIYVNMIRAGEAGRHFGKRAALFNRIYGKHD